ncbi:hypothetical protein [Burkholderia gladioli]|uniref:hypothetical protein n=1 Tax=Burkholderia gladioli TaxID=28095 RepID=UPI00163F942F|nr:hypothetical protein [Burkholderia gladioli]
MIVILVDLVVGAIVVGWLAIAIAQDIGRIFEYWLMPATLSIYFGAALLFVAPAPADASLQTAYQMLAETNLGGILVSLCFMILGALFLAIGAGLRNWRTSWTSRNH